ncbi:IS66 family insertion sequence element accessory protein TnpB [Candidatus Dependentiae bacterium]|nr:IS66 family insertion sequence element accessory protein TnpB [Candidatus Dependentiae bacterium]
MFFERKGLRVFVYREAIDMRAGFEKLLSFCVHQMRAEMNQGHVYLFFGKNRKRLKVLVYDGSGLVLIAKRIERGSFMQHLELMGRSEINLNELKLILHGSIIRQPIIDRSMSSKNVLTQRESVALPIGVDQHL